MRYARTAWCEYGQSVDTRVASRESCERTTDLQMLVILQILITPRLP